MTRRIVGGLMLRIGGLMLRIGGKLRPTAVRLEEAPAPACWRCGGQLFFGSPELAVGDESFPWVWVCPGCLTDKDVAARDNEGAGT